MEVEIHWEIESALAAEEKHKLNEIINLLPGIVEHFSFFKDQNLVPPLHLNIVIINDAHMKELNTGYRNINHSTDVLTFPFDHETALQAAMNFGEIYISQETAIRQSRGQNLSLLEEFIILIVHGLLHAFHYDHEISRQASIEMSQFEKKVLEYLGSGNINPLTN